MVRPAPPLVALGVVLGAASCGSATPVHPTAGAPTESTPTAAATHPLSGCRGFSLSLASDRGGQPSPLTAAEWFTGHGGVTDLPPAGWHEDHRDESGTVLRSGNVTLHAVQGPDDTWQVDSGSWC